MIAVIIILGIVATAIILGLAVNYNRLIELNVKAQKSWSEVDVVLKERHDLIPNLVSVVGEYAKHEKATLTAVTQLRTQAEASETVKNRSDVEHNLSQMLKTMVAVVENYPALKADKSFHDLHEELIAIENEIAKARHTYNTVIVEYNTLVQSFPSNFIAELFNFKVRDFFQLQDMALERAVPNVKIN